MRFHWPFWRRRKREQELDEELCSHLVMAIRERIEQGEDPAEAEASARREFGNMGLVKDVTRDIWGWRWLETLLQDLRYGLRQLHRNPGFTAVAVLTLALGIGANATIFSVVNAVYLMLPSVRNPDGLVVVGSKPPRGNWYAPVSSADFADWRAQSSEFAGLAASTPADDMNLVVHGAPLDAAGMRVTRNYFQVLGIHPALGSGFTAGREGGRADDEVILSDGLWREYFGADPQVIGSPVTINNKTFTIVGIMPRSFSFWAGRAIWFRAAQLWVPLTGPPSRNSRSLLVIGRLKTGVAVEQASAEMATIATHLSHEYPVADKGWSAGALMLQDYRAQGLNSVGRPLRLEMPAVCLVLLIACANIAGLLLARGASRRQEFAIRAALGAGRWRLLGQLISESLALVVLGGACGLFLAWGGTHLLHSWIGFAPGTRAIPLKIDAKVIGFTVGLSLLAVILAALLPALGASRANPDAALKAGSRTGSVTSRVRLRRVLVGGEIALAVVLLAAAGVLIRSVVGQFASGYGFNARGIWSFGVRLPAEEHQDPASRIRFFQSAANRIVALPGVSSVAVLNGMPVALPNAVPFSVTNAPPEERRRGPWASYYDVSAGYFKTMQIPLLRGRTFTEDDSANSPHVAIINEALARRYFADQDPLGHYISIAYGSFVMLSGGIAPASGSASPRRIVGVVGNVKDSVLQQAFHPQVYVPLEQAPLSEAIFALRWHGNGAPPEAALVSAVWSAGSKSIRVSDPESMSEMVDKLGGGEAKLVARLMGSFAFLALLLAAVGVYGVVAYIVTQRTQEFGVRIALGARWSDVLFLVLREAALVGGCGLAAGVLLATALPRLLGSMFFGLSTGQAPVLAGVAVTMAAVVLLASYIPARRAAKVDPMVALRYE